MIEGRRRDVMHSKYFDYLVIGVLLLFGAMAWSNTFSNVKMAMSSSSEATEEAATDQPGVPVDKDNAVK